MVLWFFPVYWLRCLSACEISAFNVTRQVPNFGISQSVSEWVTQWVTEWVSQWVLRMSFLQYISPRSVIVAPMPKRQYNTDSILHPSSYHWLWGGSESLTHFNGGHLWWLARLAHPMETWAASLNSSPTPWHGIKLELWSHATTLSISFD